MATSPPTPSKQAYLLALNCGSSSLKLKLFSLHLDGVDPSDRRLRRGSSTSSLSTSSYFHGPGPASIDLPPGVDLLMGASVNLKGEAENRSAVLKWSRLPADAAVDLRHKITLQHTEIATEGFLQEILDILINTFTATRASSTLALPALPAPDLRSSIRFITHRVVHGAGFPHPYVISHNPSDEDERAAQLLSLERLEALAPLHNIVSTRVIKLCLRVMPNADQLCLWDTAFHWTIPEEISTYPVWQPEAIQLPGGMPLRKWGFHGLSYSSVLRQVPDPARHDSTAGTDLSEQGRVTVPGSEGVQIDWAEWELNSKSGWLALAGTRDFEEIVARKDGRVEGCTDEERRKARLAFDVFVDRVLAYLGAYTFKILATGAQHVDALVFSGGIGEHSTELRMALAAKLEHTPLALRSADGGFYGSEKVGGVRRILGPPREGGTKWSGEAAPSSPLGPGPSPSTPGSPRTLHGTTCGRWGVPWLVAETDEEMECVRLSMPKIRNLWSSSLEHE
ncbi:unnamed protein product [Tilletia caries]|uniref:Acetate kinase n=1 Tax=Tilletia caries TaxID=13290 RepID=A0ABN7IL99_9BASI|nr:unnamed protein product [Tilletia caries]